MLHLQNSQHHNRLQVFPPAKIKVFYRFKIYDSFIFLNFKNMSTSYICAPAMFPLGEKLQYIRAVYHWKSPFTYVWNDQQFDIHKGPPGNTSSHCFALQANRSKTPPPIFSSSFSTPLPHTYIFLKRRGFIVLQNIFLTVRIDYNCWK